MRRCLRRALICLAGGLFLVLAGFAWGVRREYARDPMPLIDLPAGPLHVREMRSRPGRTASGEPRRFVDLEIDGVPAGPLRATLSLPEGFPGPLPAVLILGGLEVGRESLRYVERHGANALVAFEYPVPGQPPSPFRLDRIRGAALAVPAQVCALLGWMRQQTWADPQRVSLLGYSFGAMFVPACARLAQARGIPLRALVMAFGGADLPGLLAANWHRGPRWFRPLAAHAAGALIRPLEPALHLPHLRGEALFLNGLQDDRVPLPLARRMRELKPAPKTILELDEGHMDPAKPALNRRIVAASQAWLVEKGALDP
ncbi:MAG TPA: hypothetical protein VJ570_05140 [Holophagaceae bacterium]|nr:hypothetical protein [Holophagaceae bacterium]